MIMLQSESELESDGEEGEEGDASSGSLHSGCLGVGEAFPDSAGAAVAFLRFEGARVVVLPLGMRG